MADVRRIICIVVLCFGIVYSQDTESTKDDELKAILEEMELSSAKSQVNAINDSIELKPNETNTDNEQNRTLLNAETDLNVTNSLNGSQSDSGNQTEAQKPSPPKWLCSGREMSPEFSGRVVLVNESVLLQWVNTSGNASDGCAVVMFFAQFCAFSAQVAPMFNAFGRAFNNTPVLAIDAYQHNSMNARFGVVATPTILIFHGGKPVLKFNHSKTLDDLQTFVKNYTGLEGNTSVEIEPMDYEGPVSSTAVLEPDYYLLFSFLFLICYGTFVFSKSNRGHQVWEKLSAVEWSRTLQWFKKKQE